MSLREESIHVKDGRRIPSYRMYKIGRRVRKCSLKWKCHSQKLTSGLIWEKSWRCTYMIFIPIIIFWKFIRNSSLLHSWSTQFDENIEYHTGKFDGSRIIINKIIVGESYVFCVNLLHSKPLCAPQMSLSHWSKYSDLVNIHICEEVPNINQNSIFVGAACVVHIFAPRRA